MSPHFLCSVCLYKISASKCLKEILGLNHKWETRPVSSSSGGSAAGEGVPISEVPFVQCIIKNMESVSSRVMHRADQAPACLPCMGVVRRTTDRRPNETAPGKGACATENMSEEKRGGHGGKVSRWLGEASEEGARGQRTEMRDQAQGTAGTKALRWVQAGLAMQARCRGAHRQRWVQAGPAMQAPCRGVHRQRWGPGPGSLLGFHGLLRADSTQ